MLDKRGTGLSDRVREVPTLETRMDDAASDDAVVWTVQEGVRLAVLFAATYPERTAGLAFIDPSARGRRTPDYPWSPTDQEWKRRLAEVRGGWGTREFLERFLREWAPAMADDQDFRDWFVWHMRRSLSPGAALAFFRMMMESDVTDVLPAVRVPTLILYKTGEPGPARYFAERMPNAELTEIPGLTGGSGYTWLDDRTHEMTMREIERFVSRLPQRGEPERVLATVLFIDMVGSTELASSLG